MWALNVMVVDDSLIVNKKLEAILTAMGHKMIYVARTGADAVRAYGACNPDLVTMDITMPDMDGIEATRRIVERYPDALIIMVTSHGQEAMVMDALEAGAKGYVLKPVKQERLESVIAQVLKRHR